MSIKRQSAWGMLPLLVLSVVNIFSMPLFLRWLGSDMYALWFYVLTFTGMFGFADMGLAVAVGRYISVALGRNDHAAVRGYWGTGNLIMLPFLALVSLVFIGLGVWLGPKWFNIQPADVSLLRACFAAGGLGLFLSYYGTYWLCLSQAHLDFKFISLLRVVMGLLQVVPAIALAYFTKSPLLLVLWGALVAVLQLGIFMWHARRKYQLGFELQSASLARAREMASYTGKSFIGLMIGSTFVSIDRVILGRLALPVDFNSYTISANLAGRLQGFSVAVMGPVLFGAARVVDSGHAAAAKIYNDTFAFVFEWYLLAALWVGLWHPVLLKFWLGHTMGTQLGGETAALVGPLLVPLVAACCLSALANISGAQLASLNRQEAAIGFSMASGLLAIAGVWLGWHGFGAVGAAYGYLFSRLALVAQDLFTIRLLRAGGWCASGTWRQAVWQLLVSAGFATVYLFLPADSVWLLVPAAIHGGSMAAWFLRQPLRKMIA